MNEDPSGLALFISGGMDPRRFAHREHVRMGFEMLRGHDFAQSLLWYSRALRLMSARASKPEAFHQTITVAYLALIAERMQAASYPDFAAFITANPDLMDKSVLGRWYRPERLASHAARCTFLLPEPAL
jgi:hypothetical protein